MQHEAILSIDLALGVIRRSLKLITFVCLWVQTFVAKVKGRMGISLRFLNWHGIC